MAKGKRASNIVTMPTPMNANEPAPPPVSSPDANAVAQRAFEIYESRGRIDGYDVEDWLQAERELKSIAVRAS
jgi:hypothetical protein